MPLAVSCSKAKSCINTMYSTISSINKSYNKNSGPVIVNENFDQDNVRKRKRTFSLAFF